MRTTFAKPIRLCIAAGAVACLIFAVRADAQPTARERWLRAESGAVVVYSSAPRGKTRDIAEAIVELRNVLDWLAGGETGSAPEEAITVYAFGSERAMRPYLRAPPARDIRMMTESYIGIDRVHVALNATEPPVEVLPWVHRAYVGYRLLRRNPNLPYWARLGLAGFNSTFSVEREGTVRLGLPDQQMLRRLRTRSWVPLPQLFQLDASSPALEHGETLGLVQAQSWLITHLLMTGGGGESRASDVYGSLAQGIPPEEAIRNAFGEDLAAFERRLQGYSRGSTMSYMVLHPELPRPAVTVTPVSRNEVLLRLGRYLVETHEPVPVAFAEAHLEPLVGEEGWQGDALAALAELRHQVGRGDEAGALFEQALAAAPREAMSYYFYARFLADSGGEAALPSRRAALERAVELDPELGQAWADLAQTCEAIGDDAAAVAALERAVDLLPDQPVVAYNLAITRLRLGELERARETVTRYLAGPARQQLARRALDQIERVELVEATNRAIQDGDPEEAISLYRQAVERADDPASRARMQAELEQLERQVARQRQAEMFNQAVAAYNSQDPDRARTLVEELLAQSPEPDLAAQAQQLLEALNPPD